MEKRKKKSFTEDGLAIPSVDVVERNLLKYFDYMASRTLESYASAIRYRITTRGKNDAYRSGIEETLKSFAYIHKLPLIVEHESKVIVEIPAIFQYECLEDEYTDLRRRVREKQIIGVPKEMLQIPIIEQGVKHSVLHDLETSRDDLQGVSHLKQKREKLVRRIAEDGNIPMLKAVKILMQEITHSYPPFSEVYKAGYSSAALFLFLTGYDLLSQQANHIKWHLKR